MNKHAIYIPVIVVLLALWLHAQWRVSQLNAEVDRVYQGDVIIQAVDANSNEPVTIAFSPPGTTTGQRWPKYETTMGKDTSEMRFKWIDIAPIQVRVSADGYAGQQLTLDQNTKDRVIVQLRR